MSFGMKKNEMCKGFFTVLTPDIYPGILDVKTVARHLCDIVEIDDKGAMNSDEILRKYLASLRQRKRQNKCL